MFRINHLTKRYGQSTILDELNLEINYGEIVGIIGENGAGKTTLFNIISGFESFESGEINLDNQSIHSLEPHTRAELGLARTFQSEGLFPNLTVYENLELAFRLPNEAGTAAKLLHFFRFGKQELKDSAIHTSLSNVKMLEHKDKLAKDLSGGQQKLVEIARINIQNWKILFLDEPLSGVSENLKSDLVEKIKGLKQENKSIVLIEHDIEFVKKVADRIFTLSNGRLTEIFA